ncbi:MAG: SOS response-associated peptidase, partial [Magnetococcales bacterium]|nr:SOS response-associated peptidase [Magnetococcales bacterium]
KGGDVGGRFINARSETVASKPAFRDAYQSRRCLVPADGFYEWKRDGVGGKCPYFIGKVDRRPFAFGGLWESWLGGGDDGGGVETFTVLTTEPNDVVRPIHNRMPLIIDPADYSTWLDCETHDMAAVDRLLHPIQATKMHAFAVSSFVNSTSNEGPGCIEPSEEEKQLSLF